MPSIQSPINQDQKQQEQLGVALAQQAHTQVAALPFIKQQDTAATVTPSGNHMARMTVRNSRMYRSVANLKISKQTAVRASEAAMLAIQGIASDSFSRKAINAKRPVAIAS